MKRLFAISISVAASLGALTACETETTKVVTEYDVIEVPGETVYIDRVDVIEVPVVVTEYDVIEVPGETVYIDRVDVVEVPGETVVVEVEVVPPCGPTQPQGACDAGETCFGGECVETATLCSPTNLIGLCAEGMTCFTGGCVLTSGLCSATNLTGPCELGSSCVDGVCVGTADLCSETNHEGVCPSGLECLAGICGEPTVDPCTVHVFTEQPVLGVSTAMLSSDKLELLQTNYDAWRVDNPEAPELAGPPNIRAADGIDFKDLNGNGVLDPYEDWRLNASCRAWDLVSRMTMDQKIGTMSEGGRFGNGTADSSLSNSAINAVVNQHRRYSLIRAGSIDASQVAQYHNQVQALAERQPLGIPATITADPIHAISQSTDSTTGIQSLRVPSLVSPWPRPIGLGAINDVALTARFADIVRIESREMGITWQLGPMADLATEPRWGRVGALFGENAFHVAHHIRTMIRTMQGNDLPGGLHEGIASSIKHFPGAGPDEDGMDSHGYEGRYNVFPGDHFTYHLIPFQAAFDEGVAALMPCYSIFADLDYDPEQVGAGFSYTLMTKLLKEEMGFTGMISGDWGTLADAFNTEAMSAAQRAAMWIHAGSHQFGSDSESNFLNAYNEGYLDDWDIDQAVAKILEMTFKLGLFENPYVDPAAPSVRSEAFRVDGFNAQKRAVIVLRNSGSPLPIHGARGTNVDTNDDGLVTVYYDGVVDGLAGTDYMQDLLGEYDYNTAASEGLLAIEGVEDIDTADIAVLRITTRPSARLDAGVPLSWDGIFPGQSNDNTRAAGIQDRNRVIAALRARDGYTDADGVLVEPSNPTLRIVIVVHMDRPAILAPWVEGTNLDELPGEPGSYHLVSDPANVGGEGRTGVNGIVVEFGAVDRAVLDVLFTRNLIEGYPYSRARLPWEIPSSDAAVEAQFEDVPADSLDPTYHGGSGSNLNAP